jgi:phytoene dehydrogenase-like protein
MKPDALSPFVLIVTILVGCTTTDSASTIAYRIDQGGQIYTESEVDEIPTEKKPLHVELEDLNLDHAEAHIVLVVDTDGKVMGAQLVGTTNDEFGKRAIEAAKRCEFIPAKKGDLFVKCAFVKLISITKVTKIRTEIRNR